MTSHPLNRSIDDYRDDYDIMEGSLRGPFPMLTAYREPYDSMKEWNHDHAPSVR